MSNIEQTLSIIKPDAVERNLQDQIKQEFTNKGFEIIKEKKIPIISPLGLRKNQAFNINGDTAAEL